MKRIYAVENWFYQAYNGEEITDAEWVERAEDNGMIWSSPQMFAFDLNDGEIRKGEWLLRVIDLEGTYEESNDKFDRPVLLVPTEMTYRGMDELTIADLASNQGTIYDDFDMFVRMFNDNSCDCHRHMQMFIGSMTLGLMEEILDILKKKEDDGKVTIRLTKSQVEDIINLIIGETARTRVIEDAVADYPVKRSLAQYRERLLDTMNDIHSQLPNDYDDIF